MIEESDISKLSSYKFIRAAQFIHRMLANFSNSGVTAFLNARRETMKCAPGFFIGGGA